jgi:glycosyltransferase involved in cell wall biosynthesis
MRETVVYIVVTHAGQAVERRLPSVGDRMPADVTITLIEAPERPPIGEHLAGLGREVQRLWPRGAPSPVALANTALMASASADVVLVASDALVPPGWLERIRNAGRSDTTVATASALFPGGGPLSPGLPGADAKLEPDLIARRVAARSPRTRPRIPTADGPCVWLSRAALELAGPLDEAFGSLRAALVDFAQRCVACGFVNVAADDLFVPSADPSGTASAGPLDVGSDRPLLESRYPYLEAALREPASPAVPVSLTSAGPSRRTTSVTIDARIVRGPFSGTHAETLELIEALARTGQLKVRAVLDPSIGTDALEILDRARGVERVYAPDVGDDIERTDVVHRPYQVTSAEDLDLLARLGEWVVITHLDLIAYHNPSYFDSFESWDYHRRVTRHALAMANRVIFLSEHAARDAIREQLVERERISVLAPAVNRERTQPEPHRPNGAPSAPFLLQIGNDFRHKNRLFSIKLLAELRDCGWEGELVLAGANVGPGSSRGEEAAYLGSRPGLGPLVHDLPPVDEAEKAWLYSNAAAISYPSVCEGFGLIPFEAAQAGKPCLFAPQASLGEVLPSEAAVLVPWDMPGSAENALPLLTDGDARSRQIGLVRKAAERMGDWTSLGQALLELYDETAEMPLRRLTHLPRLPQAKKSRGPLTRIARAARRLTAKVRGSR